MPERLVDKLWETGDGSPEPKENFSSEELKLVSIIIEELKNQEAIFPGVFEDSLITIDGVFDLRLLARVIIQKFK